MPKLYLSWGTDDVNDSWWCGYLRSAFLLILTFSASWWWSGKEVSSVILRLSNNCLKQQRIANSHNSPETYRASIPSYLVYTSLHSKRGLLRMKSAVFERNALLIRSGYEAVPCQARNRVVNISLHWIDIGVWLEYDWSNIGVALELDRSSIGVRSGCSRQNHGAPGIRTTVSCILEVFS